MNKKNTQSSYDKYVVGNTKLGRNRSKYVPIEKGGANCINILKQATAIRSTYLFESLTQTSLAGEVFREALLLLEVDREDIPRMSNWELQTLAKFMKNMHLFFWEIVLNEFVLICNKEAKAKYGNNLDSSLTAIEKPHQKAV